MDYSARAVEAEGAAKGGGGDKGWGQWSSKRVHWRLYITRRHAPGNRTSRREAGRRQWAEGTEHDTWFLDGGECVMRGVFRYGSFGLDEPRAYIDMAGFEGVLLGAISGR